MQVKEALDQDSTSIEAFSKWHFLWMGFFIFQL